MLKTLAVLWVISSHVSGLDECGEENYLSNQELIQELDRIVDEEPRLVTSYDIGSSFKGIPLRVVRISGASEEAMVPQVKLIGGIHGDEPPSTHTLLNFIKYLIISYRSEEIFVTWLLNNTRLHILPRMNPDGFEDALEGICDLGTGRRNHNGVDLNRGFPQVMDSEPAPAEPEIEAVTRWSDEESFVLSASLHTGSLVAVYPLDSPQNGLVRHAEKAPTTDDDVFIHLAKTYARNHPTMSGGFGCEGGVVFPDGIINGAEWYQAKGSMMDYNYFYPGTMELTLEINCCKYPAPHHICNIWRKNKLGLLKLCAESIRGVRGRVTSSGIPLPMAVVTVYQRDMPVYTNARGEFFRILLPGKYHLKFEMIGMESKTVEVVVKKQDTALYTWTEVNVDLQPEIPTTRPHTGTSGDLDKSSLGGQESHPTGFYDMEGIDPDELPTNTTSVTTATPLPNATGKVSHQSPISRPISAATPLPNATGELPHRINSTSHFLIRKIITSHSSRLTSFQTITYIYSLLVFCACLNILSFRKHSPL